jgi:hypothetical protein
MSSSLPRRSALHPTPEQSTELTTRRAGADRSRHAGAHRVPGRRGCAGMIAHRSVCRLRSPRRRAGYRRQPTPRRRSRWLRATSRRQSADHNVPPTEDGEAMSAPREHLHTPRRRYPPLLPSAMAHRWQKITRPGILRRTGHSPRPRPGWRNLG